MCRYFCWRATRWSVSGTLFLCGDDDDDDEGRAGSSGKCSMSAALQRERERETKAEAESYRDRDVLNNGIKHPQVNIVVSVQTEM